MYLSRVNTKINLRKEQISGILPAIFRGGGGRIGGLDL